MSKKNEAQKLQEELTWSAPHIAKEAPEPFLRHRFFHCIRLKLQAILYAPFKELVDSRNVVKSKFPPLSEWQK